jgi:excisionase family DNA binding protein
MEFYTAKDIAKILQISKTSAYQLLRSNQIATVRIGKSVRVRKEDLEEYIQKSRQEASLEL